MTFEQEQHCSRFHYRRSRRTKPRACLCRRAPPQTLTDCLSRPFARFRRQHFACLLRRPHPSAPRPALPGAPTACPALMDVINLTEKSWPALHGRQHRLPCHASHVSSCFSDFWTVHSPSKRRSCPRLSACHVSTSCHLGVHRTLRVVERFRWLIDLDRSVCW